MSTEPRADQVAMDAADRMPLAHLWTLRLLRHASWSSIKRAPGEVLAHLLDRQGELEPKSLQEFRGWVADELSAAENLPANRCGPLFENTGSLSSTLGLSREESEILLFRAILRIDGRIEELSLLLGEFSDTRLILTLADVLRLDINGVRRALNPKSRLLSCGLFHFGLGPQPLMEKTGLALGFSEAVLLDTAQGGPVSRFATIAPEPRLTRDCYPHLQEEIRLVCAYFANAKQGGSGRNVLMFGPPGTGKTELARIIAKEVGATLYEVSEGTLGDASSDPRARVGIYVFLQRLLAADRNAIVLFDEIEDLFSRSDSPKNDKKPGAGHPGKDWMNRALEDNAVPTIWISNAISQIDPAHLRRFDICIELKVPPKPVRESVLRNELRGLAVDDHWVREVAESADMSPGVLARIARVARDTSEQGAGDLMGGMNVLLKHRLSTLGLSDPRKRNAALADYRMEHVNSEPDISTLPDRLREAGKGQILLYGPPGTGKTAFVHYLAQKLDRRILAKRASDVISMWVGSTEKNLARMFEEAAEDDSILLLDEADSFLQDRRQALRSWEISEVNELLTQMEGFDGLFMCATNLIETLDRAAMRRFNLKVRFEPLRAAQRHALFEGLLDALNAARPDEVEWQRLRKRLDALDGLTPGDFEAVRRQFKLLERCCSVADIAAALEEEFSLGSEGKQRGVGFVS